MVISVLKLGVLQKLGGFVAPIPTPCNQYNTFSYIIVSTSATSDRSVQWIHLNIFHIATSVSLRMLLLLRVAEVLLTVEHANKIMMNI